MLCHIIVAAGSGSRFGTQIPKQYCLLNSRPMVMTTIDRLRRCSDDALLILVISPDMEQYWHDLCRQYSFRSPQIVFGGPSRAQSVKNAIIALPDSVSLISVHDGARPLVTPELLSRLLDALTPDIDGVIPAVPLTDSLRQKLHDGGSVAVDRASFVAVQTPQIFNADKLKKAYEHPLTSNMTDDASVMEAAGFSKIKLVTGDHDNIKVTNAADIEIAEIILRHQNL